MKKLMILGLLFFFCGLAIAQKPLINEHKIKGIVVESKNVPVPFANVLLYSIQDSVTAKGTTTDEEGKFEITAHSGKYYLKISFLSYQTRTVSDIGIINSGIVLDKIVLAENSQLLNEVVVTGQKSARYDAEGEVGIINIVLKKNKNKGFNGVFTANGGYPLYYGGSYSVNYRKDKLNFFSNNGVSYRTDQGKGNTYQRYSGADTSFIFSEKSTDLRRGLSNNITFGLDYYFTEKSSLTASFLYENSIEKNSSKIDYTDFAGDNSFIQATKREESEKSKENNFEAALSYKKKFERKDQEFTVDFKWMQTTEPNNSDIKQYNAGGINDLNQRSGTTEDEYNYLLQLDYVHPFLTNIKLETGIKS